MTKSFRQPTADPSGELRERLQSLAHAEPPGDAAESELQRHAAALLRRATLHAFGAKCELVELEYYCHSPSHPDPFAHRAAQQARCGFWHLHRQGTGGFRSGSFKGLDFTFGRQGTTEADESAATGAKPRASVFGGMLIRSLKIDEGQVINGPSLCVDYLLERFRESSSSDTSSASLPTVAMLHQQIGELQIWDPANPLRLELSAVQPATERFVDEVYATPRVGLTLKRIGWAAAKPYLLRRYRWLRFPADVKKGRVQTILAMSADGLSVDEIRQRTGSPTDAIQRHLTQANMPLESPEELEGETINSQQLCRLWGACRIVESEGV